MMSHCIRNNSFQGIHWNQGWARQAPTRHAGRRSRGGRAAAISDRRGQNAQSISSRRWRHLVLRGTNVGRSSWGISLGLPHGAWACGGWWMGGDGAALGGETANIIKRCGCLHFIFPFYSSSSSSLNVHFHTVHRSSSEK